MASVEKFTESAVVNQIRHCNRTIKNNSNHDIDARRSHLNYSLTPERKVSDYEYYQQRKQELYCYNRKDVKTMCGWIITAPKELKNLEEEKIFFKKAYKFLENRYGKENVISSTVHYDEGKTSKIKDRWGDYLKDESGNIKTELVLGRPHLHFCFIPVVADKNPKHIQTEKICCNDVLNKKELQQFHSDLSKATNCPYVMNGRTKSQGRNYTVEEMKEQYEMKKELERLREIERRYNLEHTRTIWRW